MNPSYNGVGTQAPQNNSQMPGQAGPVGAAGATGSVSSVGQPIVSSGAGDVVLSGGDSGKKSSRKGVVALIVLVVLVALAGGGFLLWQNGVFGGRNSETAQQTESLEAAYNSYVNYVLWGVESDGRPDLANLTPMVPYYDTLKNESSQANGQALNAYLDEADRKFENFSKYYNAYTGGNSEIDVTVLKNYFEDLNRIDFLNEKDIAVAYENDGEDDARKIINAAYSELALEYNDEYLLAYIDVRQKYTDFVLGTIVGADRVGCLQDGEIVSGCYSLSEDEVEVLNKLNVDAMEALSALTDTVVKTIEDLQEELYGGKENA